MKNYFKYFNPISLTIFIVIFLTIGCNEDDDEKEIREMVELSEPESIITIDSGISIVGLGLTGQLTATIDHANTVSKTTNNINKSTKASVSAARTIAKPAMATSKELAWSSSDENIATVDESGLVTGIAPGEVTITVTSMNDDKILDSKVILVTSGKSDITSFAINGVKGVINGININVTLPDSADVRSLQPVITHTGTSINPGAKIAQDFTNPVVYTVMGEDGSTLKWTVSVSTGTNDENNDGAFVTTWDAQEIAIPTDPNFEYDYSVDWDNDGIIDESGITGNITHTFEDDGEHTIRITGTFPAIQFGSLSQEEAEKIISVDQWGNGEWLSMFDAFANCSNLEIPATDSPDLSKANRITRMFRNASSANPDVSGWNTSNVKYMNALFKNASSANPDVSNWNISNIKVMRQMFEGSAISSENYGKALIRFAAHENDPELTLPQDVEIGEVPASFCGQEAQNAKDILLGKGWILNDLGQGAGCEEELEGFITTWKAREITIPINTYEEFTYNYNVDWNNDGITDETGITGDITHTFENDGEHTIRITGTFPAIRFAPRVGEIAGPYWKNAEKIISIDQWGTNEWLSFQSAFNKCINLQVKATDAPDLSKVTHLSRMFMESGLGDADFSHWNTSSVTNMSAMFAYTTNATHLNISNWNTSNVTDMGGMFAGVASNPDISNWNTGKVEQMGEMFAYSSTANPDLSKWNFSSLKQADFMFSGALGPIGLSQENYEKFLIRLAEHESDPNLTLPEKINLGNVPVSICSQEAQAAKALLLSKGWTINDQGVDPACQSAPAVVPEFLTKLSELNLYEGNMSSLTPSSHVFEYDLNTPLFTDYAKKQRLIAIPEGATMTSNGDGLPDYPDNTVIAKTFYYYTDDRTPSIGKKIIETRVLIKKNGEWKTGNYKWNAAQTDATYTQSSSNVDISFTNSEGETINIDYVIPGEDDCFMCHQTYGETTPIGPKLRNMNKVVNGKNQIQALMDMQWINGVSHPNDITKLPDWEDSIAYPSREIRARAYFEVNCAHCHSDGGYRSFINLSFETPFNETPLQSNYYQNRIPEVIGSGYMPYIGTTLVHEEGLDLIEKYIQELE